MPQDFSEFYKKYAAIIAEADAVFNTVKKSFAENVRCEKGCSDCCHALFDLALVEALHLNQYFNAKFSCARIWSPSAAFATSRTGRRSCCIRATA